MIKIVNEVDAVEKTRDGLKLPKAVLSFENHDNLGSELIKDKVYQQR